MVFWLPCRSAWLVPFFSTPLLLFLLGFTSVKLIHLKLVIDPLYLQVVKRSNNPECRCRSSHSNILWYMLSTFRVTRCPLHSCHLPIILNHPLFYIGYFSSNLPYVVYNTLAISFSAVIYGLLKVLFRGRGLSYLLVLETKLSDSITFLYDFLSRRIHHKKCLATFNWDGNPMVGTPVSFEVSFFLCNGWRYPITDTDNYKVEVRSGTRQVSVVTEMSTDEEKLNSLKCTFTTRYSGCLTIDIIVTDIHIKGSPFTKTFRSGPFCPTTTSLSLECSTIICEARSVHCFQIEPKDEYHNLCIPEHSDLDVNEYTLNIYDVSSIGSKVDSNSVIYCNSGTNWSYEVCFSLNNPGCYNAELAYKNTILPQGKFSIVALTEGENIQVTKSISKRSTDSIQVSLVGEGDSSSSPNSWKKIYCHVTPKQFILTDYFLWVIPRRLHTFRLCPYTKLVFSDSINSESKFLTIDDGCQKPITIASKDRSVIAASFYKFMLRNIGGSESFKDKQVHFYSQIREVYCKSQWLKHIVNVDRENLLDSSMESTKGFGTSHWLRSFMIHFNQESGLDWGGVSREWVELLCTKLFDSNGGFFSCFNENSEDTSQSLVHPNPVRPPHLNVKYYEFAGKLVGKCLIESAKGSNSTLLVKARFTRSFLAQLIGLRVSYKHFEHDDPELYSGMVQHLLKNGVDLLPEPIYFTDCHKGENGELKTVDLVNGGSSIQVTNGNIPQYLDALAQYRMVRRVSAEVQAFQSGFNKLIPDNLLCIFDENELELLMCGTEEYKITDMKKHTVVSVTFQFSRILYWFWTAVANFTDEEMARLLQFITGCSRLPPGGFSHLSPKLEIISLPMFNTLPMAHTCFNQLCLPDYESYEMLEKSLLIAIKEGSEGFGLA